MKVRFPEPAELDVILRRAGSPAFVLLERGIRENVEELASVASESGARIIAALKGFSCPALLPLVGRHLPGATASSPHEARLARETVGGEVHAYAPAYTARDVVEMAPLVDDFVFNSFRQWRTLAPHARRANPSVRFGLRVNPEHSEGHTALYDPCAPGSRLGVRRAAFEGEDLSGLSGLHFHTLCEHDADALERTLAVFERKFGEFLPGLEWVNFGGGHHITREGYDRARLVRVVRDFRARHPHLTVYLEPGEAVALNAGVLVATVLDLVPGEPPVAILDTSATAHMPDVLEMPYRPAILGAGDPGSKACDVALGGLTCLAGDVLGIWSFDRVPEIGERLVFGDMAHYTMVKTTTFNGVRLPDIAVLLESGELRLLRRFGYESFRSRLG